MIAMSTDYVGESTCVEELEATLATIAQAGINSIHWCHEWDGDYSYSIYEMIQIKEWMKKYNLGIKALHATEGCHKYHCKEQYHYRWAKQNRRDYTSENELNRLAGVDLIKNRVDTAHYLGATEIVLHMGLPYKSFEEDASFKERYFNQVCKSFRELQYYSTARNVKICVENLLGVSVKHQMYQFDLLFREFPSDFLGICLDTGHANIVYDSSKNESCLDFAKRYKDRIFVVHMSDNHGISSKEAWEDGAMMSACDEHLLPFEGTFDWEGFAKILAQSPYKQPYLLETACRENDQVAYLKKALEVGKKFASMVK